MNFFPIGTLVLLNISLTTLEKLEKYYGQKNDHNFETYGYKSSGNFLTWPHSCGSPPVFCRPNGYKFRGSSSNNNALIVCKSWGSGVTWIESFSCA